VLPSTAEHVLTSLAGWLPLSALVCSLTPAKAQRLYEELTQRISERTGKVLAVATHQFFLSCAKGWVSPRETKRRYAVKNAGVRDECGA
jgi:hypothetical protein